MDRVYQLPPVVCLHLLLLGGILPVVELIHKLALVPDLVKAQLLLLGVHGRLNGSLEDRVDRQGVAEGHAPSP